MQFLLSDSDVTRAIHAAHRRADGMLIVDLPASRLLDGAEPRPALTFDPETRVVHCNGVSARLSPTQFTLLQHVYTHGRTAFETAQDVAWQRRKVSDGAIRAACSKTNAQLSAAHIPAELSAYRAHVTLEFV